MCPHQKAALAAGILGGLTVASQPGGAFESIREGEILRCPWHEWEYDIKTGESVFDPKVRVATYPVEVVDGAVTVVLE